MTWFKIGEHIWLGQSQLCRLKPERMNSTLRNAVRLHTQCMSMTLCACEHRTACRLYATDAQLGVHLVYPQTSHTSVLNCSADDSAMSTMQCLSLSIVPHHLISDKLQKPTKHR